MKTSSVLVAVLVGAVVIGAPTAAYMYDKSVRDENKQSAITACKNKSDLEFEACLRRWQIENSVKLQF